jgi:hypothetical protein
MTTTITGATGVNQITDDAITVAKLPAGSVLQVVHNNFNTHTTSSSGTYADTGLQMSITPTSSSSKILVLVSQCGVRKEGGDAYMFLKLVRDSTDLVQISITSAYTASTALNSGSESTCFLDSPNTTSSVVYKTQFFRGNVGNVHVQVNGVKSTITLMEIAG